MPADGLHPLLPAQDGGSLLVGQQLSCWSVSARLSAGAASGWLAGRMSASLSSAGSTSSSLCDHWINRLPGSRAASLASGASSRRTSLASLAESVEFPPERGEDDGEAERAPAARLRADSRVALSGGFTVRPFVRSIQRQSLSSRSSVASPLASSDSAIKPSWSLAAKLNMRSNSPSRFSLDSRCSPPLERIGECCDDKVSTSCFGSYSRHERYFGSRSPPSAAESNASEPDGKRFIDVMYCRAPTPVEKKSGRQEATENNNQITAVDQNMLAAHGTPSKEQKRKSSIGGFASKAESTSSTKTSSKAEAQKTPKKRLCATHKTSESSSSTPVRGKKVSNNKDKKSASTPAGTPSKKKDPPQPAEATPQHKPCARPTPQSSLSPSPTAKKPSSMAERSSASGRRKLGERSFSRDSMHASPTVEGLRGSAAAPSPPRPSSGERRLIRSSSSSSSATSLRSPSVSSREQQRAGRPEEKGLSFFRSALRQRESRRSADLGRSSVLAKKASERTCRQNGQAKEAGAAESKGGEAASSPASAETQEGEPKASSRPASSLSRALLGKSKSSTPEVALKSPSSGKKPPERAASSRKLSGAPSAAGAAQRPQ